MAVISGNPLIISGNAASVVLTANPLTNSTILSSAVPTSEESKAALTVNPIGTVVQMYNIGKEIDRQIWS